MRGSGDVLAHFSLARKSRFPAAETAVGRDSVRMGQLFDRKPEHLVLTGPFGRQVGEADYSHAMRKPSFDRSLDEVGREEGKRDCHIDLTDAAAVARRDAFGICPRVRDELVEPAAAAGNRGDEESAVLGPYCAGVLRGHGRGHENLTPPSE